MRANALRQLPRTGQRACRSEFRACLHRCWSAGPSNGGRVIAPLASDVGKAPTFASRSSLWWTRTSMSKQTASTDGDITITISGQMSLNREVIFDMLRKLQDSTTRPVAGGSKPSDPMLPAREPERVAYSMRETADLLGVSYITVHRLLQRGLLRSSSASRHKII